MTQEGSYLSLLYYLIFSITYIRNLHKTLRKRKWPVLECVLTLECLIWSPTGGSHDLAHHLRARWRRTEAAVMTENLSPALPGPPASRVHTLQAPHIPPQPWQSVSPEGAQTRCTSLHSPAKIQASCEMHDRVTLKQLS